MKRKFWICILFMMAVCLAGCVRVDLPATEPAQLLWAKRNTYPAYEEFFAEDRTYSRAEDACSWVAGNGVQGMYTLQWDPTLPEGSRGDSLYVSGGGLTGPEKVYGNPILPDCTLLSCDGQFAYLTRADENAGVVTAVLQLELESGNIRPVLEGDALLDVSVCEDVVLYCLRCTDGQTQICRMYLPEERLDVLHTLEEPAALVRLEQPERTLGQVIWSTVRPYMRDMIESELKNRESIYRFGNENVIALWEKTDPVSDPVNRDALYLLAEGISETTGVQAAYSEAVSETMPWLRMEPYPTYDTLFTQDLTYAPEDDPCSWVMGGVRYHLERNAELTGARHGGTKLYVRSDTWQTRELVYTSEELNTCSLLFCDGRYAYFGRYVQPENQDQYRQLLQLDLKDRSMTVLAEAVGIGSVYFCGDGVLYYLRWDGKQGQICRMYLPEQREEVLGTPDVLPALLSFRRPESTLGNIRWNVPWQEYIAQVAAELANPASSYLNMASERSLFEKLWAAENPMEDYLQQRGVWTLCDRISQASEAFQDPWASHADSYSCRLTDGVISMEETPTEYPEPELLLGPWKPLPGLDVQQAIQEDPAPADERTAICGGGFLPGPLWLIGNDTVAVVSDVEIKECVAGKNAVYCITADNRILQLSWDGKVCNTLYAGGSVPLEMLQLAGGFVYVAEGENILEIDLSAEQYRVLMRQKYLVSLHCDTDFRGKYKRMYFVARQGRMNGMFSYSFEDGVLEQNRYMIPE